VPRFRRWQRVTSKQSKYYREQAERCRELARNCVDEELHDKLKAVAEEYDRLAKDAAKFGPLPS
jgi:hypothetical protein